jgi:hypothetical protein
MKMKYLSCLLIIIWNLLIFIYQYDVFDIPGAEYCLSEFGCLTCYNSSDQNIFEDLVKKLKNWKLISSYIMFIWTYFTNKRKLRIGKISKKQNWQIN